MSTDDRSSTPPARGVVHPDWEQELRAGQEADPDAPGGSVEPELEMLHLLRHARAPEALREGELDQIWGELESELYPGVGSLWTRLRSFARRGWWLAPVGASAIVLLMVGREREPALELAQGDASALQQESGETLQASPPATPGSAASTLARDGASDSAEVSASEQQFLLLASRARDHRERQLEHRRSELRTRLLAKARQRGGFQ